MFNSPEKYSLFCKNLKNELFAVAGIGVKLGHVREAVSRAQERSVTTNQHIPLLSKKKAANGLSREVLLDVANYFGVQYNPHNALQILVPVKILAGDTEDYGLAIRISIDTNPKETVYIELVAFQDSEIPTEFFGDDVTSDNACIALMIDEIIACNHSDNDTYSKKTMTALTRKKIEEVKSALSFFLAVKRNAILNENDSKDIGFDSEGNCFNSEDSCFYFGSYTVKNMPA